MNFNLLKQKKNFMIIITYMHIFYFKSITRMLKYLFFFKQQYLHSTYNLLVKYKIMKSWGFFILITKKSLLYT